MTWIALLAFAAFLPSVWMCGWIWDDDSYVTLNRVVQSSDGLWRAWIPGETPQYYPLVFVSFWIEHAIVGLHPALFHFDNVCLHAAACVCFYFALIRLRVPHAFWIAAIVAVHPMQAESVVWVTERKNVLSFLFAMASVLAWLRAEDTTSRQQVARWSAIALLCFVCAMLSKTTAVFIPPVLILIRLWERRAINFMLCVRVAPFFVLGLIGGLHTAYLEKTHVGAVGDEFSLTILQRVSLVAQNFFFYPLHALMPFEQVFIMRRWQLGQWVFGVDEPGAAALVASIVVVCIAALRWRRNRATLLILLWYSAAIFPALGFFDIYPFRYSFVADHFAYAALPAISCAVVVFFGREITNVRVRTVVGVVSIVALLTLSWRTLPRFEDEKTLWTTTRAQNRGAWIAGDNLSAIALREAEAVLQLPPANSVSEQQRRDDFVRARADDAYILASHDSWLDFDPVVSYTNRSEAARLRGDYAQALGDLDLSVYRGVDAHGSFVASGEMSAEGHWMRGRLLELLARDAEAASEYRIASHDADVRIRERALRSLLALTVRTERTLDAARVARELVEVAPNDRGAWLNLGASLIANGEHREGRRVLLVQLLSRELSEQLWVSAAVRYVRSVADDDASDADEIAAAHRFADTMVERSGGSEIAKLLLARMRLRAGDRDGARALAMEVEQKAGSDVVRNEAAAIRALTD